MWPEVKYKEGISIKNVIISRHARNKYFPGNETIRESSVFTA
jgi:hypothetical protein